MRHAPCVESDIVGVSHGPWLMAHGEKGAALLETAILLPAYCLLVVGAVYFGSIALLGQELGFFARYAAEVPGSGASQEPGEATIAVPITTGENLPDGSFVIFSGSADCQETTEPASTPDAMRRELIKVSWRATEGTVLDPATGDLRQGTGLARTREGGLIYGLGILDDHAGISDEYAAWFSRRTAVVGAQEDVALHRTEWGHGDWRIGGLPAPRLTRRASSAVRTVPDPFVGPGTRVVAPPYDGVHPAGYLFLDRWGGPYPDPGWPGYGGSGGFWVPN